MSESAVVIVRARGPLVWNLRFAGVALTLAVTSMSLVGGHPMRAAGAVFGAILWQCWLFRPRIVVRGGGLRIVGLVRSIEVPTSKVQSVDLNSGQFLTYPTFDLTIVARGAYYSTPWVAWNDMRRWGFSADPPNHSQTKVLTTLRQVVGSGGRGG